MSTQTAQKRTYTGPLAIPTRIFDWVIDFFANIANFMMAFIVVLITVEVVLRYFFNTGILWAAEITEDCLLWITFLATTWVLRKEGHVIVDLIPSRLAPRQRTMLYAILSMIGILVCLAYTWYGTTTTIDLAQRGRTLSTLLSPPAWVLYMIIPIGSFMLTIQFCRRSLKFLREFKSLKRKTA